MTPIISDAFLPIDSILYYQVHREALGAQDVTLPGQLVKPAGPHHPLPLKKINAHTPQWFYAASFAVWPNHTREGQDHWNKRMDISLIDLVDWQGRKARIDVAAGRYKSYHMPVFYRTALFVDWYVVGNKDEIERLLATVLSIGKKGAQGWGFVREWKVQIWPDDWSVWSTTGRLMRAIPTADATTVYGLRPSYWLPKNQFPCRLPLQA